MTVSEQSDNYFKTRFKLDSRRNYIWKKIALYVDKKDPAKNSILELGAGYCDWINNTRGETRIASDISSSVSKYAEPSVRFIMSSSTDLSHLKNTIFDRVQMSNLLEHLTIEEVNKTIVEIRKILKKGGSVIVIQPNYRYSYRTYFDDYTHRTVFSHISLIDLFSSHGFKVVLSQKKFLPFTIKSKFGYAYKLINLYLYFPIKLFAGQMLIIFEKIENEI
jgi:ubiquinone/menaquinone biosynthesis C-methylase UbiE